jgi:hypothetical protein
MFDLAFAGVEVQTVPGKRRMADGVMRMRKIDQATGDK